MKTVRILSTRFLAATVASICTLAIAGGLLYGVIFSKFIQENLGSATGVMKSPEFLWIGIAHIPFGVLLVLIVAWRGRYSIRDGAFAGATLGFLMAASYDLSQYGTTNLWSLKLTLVDPFIAMIMVGLAGGVAGKILGIGKAWNNH